MPWWPKWRLRWASPPAKAPRALHLPWWGLLLSSADRKAIAALLASGQRLRELLAQPGWQDVVSVIEDWIDRYATDAGRLGQQVEEQQGRMVLREQDTPQDDRRRLIAGAQAAALKGLLAELQQRAKAESIWDTRQQRARETLEDANHSLV